MLKVHLGCGPHILEGWENHDADLDLRNPLPWSDQAVDFIFAEHVIEHLTTPEGVLFVRECCRVLRPGGVVRLSFPDPAKLMRLSAQEVGDYVRTLRGYSVDVSTLDDCLNLVLLGWGHQAAWTASLLGWVLNANGFQSRGGSYGVSDEPELNGIDGHHLSAGIAARLETSVVEGVKQ
jgi:SAM-dependent methyltransferase